MRTGGRYASLWRLQGGTQCQLSALLSWLKSLPQSRLFTGHTEETEFLPAALEIVGIAPRPGRPPHRRNASSLFFVIALLWACIGSVDIIATAPGKIVPTGRTKVIQPLESGVVHAIHVQDGQKVKAGDVLIEIDTTISASERDRLKNDYMQAMLDTARLKAALNLDGDPAKKLRRARGRDRYAGNAAEEPAHQPGGRDSRQAQRSRSPDCPEHRQPGRRRLDHHQTDPKHPVPPETRRCPQIPAR